jgi:SET domain
MISRATSGKLTKSCGPLGASVVARAPIARGEPLLAIDGPVGRRPSRYTLQVGPHAHVDPAGRLWGFVNHSCDPNCRIDFPHWSIVAARPIPAGEELSFNYLTTEWDMASPFACRCGAASCWGWVQGLRHLPPEQILRLRPLLAPHLLRQLETMDIELEAEPALRSA